VTRRKWQNEATATLPWNPYYLQANHN